ncbi:hypothetical protein AAY473_007792, partial [Plecturocebus cupreus]
MGSHSTIQATSTYWAQGIPPAAASQVAGTTDVHHTQLIFNFFVEMGSCYVAQTASQIAGIIGVSHCACPTLLYLRHHNIQTITGRAAPHYTSISFFTEVTLHSFFTRKNSNRVTTLSGLTSVADIPSPYITIEEPWRSFPSNDPAQAISLQGLTLSGFSKTEKVVAEEK